MNLFSEEIHRTETVKPRLFMSLHEYEANDIAVQAHGRATKNSLLCNRNPQRQQGRLTQLQVGCEKPR